MEKKVSYLDKSYLEKRKILRNFHFMNSDCYDLTNMVRYKILERIDDEKELIDVNNLIKTILVDGYVAFEKIYDGDKLSNLIRIDPLTFNMELIDGELVWFMNKGEENSRILKKEQIIYVSFNNEDFTSFVEMVYMKVVNKTTEWTIKSVIDDVVKSYEENFKKIN